MRRLHRKTVAKQNLKQNHVAKKITQITILKMEKNPISHAMTTVVRSA